MRFFTTEQLGEKQALTPEGFLLCTDVPIARTGVMYYGPGETTIKTSLPDGRVKVIRTEEQVFRPEFVLSFAGKDFVDDHPSDGVNPENWKALAGQGAVVGTVMNPRRGTGAQADLLIADIIVKDKDAIAAIRNGLKREVSCGYDAEYEPIPGSPGEGYQVNMVGNHVALVDSGRCGHRCSIADRKNLSLGDLPMRTNDKDSTGDRASKVKAWWNDVSAVITAAAAKGKDELAAALAEIAGKPIAPLAAADAAGGDDIHVHFHRDDLGAIGDPENLGKPGVTGGMDEETKGRFEALEKSHGEMKDMIEGIANHVGYKPADAAGEAAIEGELAEEAPAGTGDRARRAKDSAYLEDSFQNAIAGAEIIVPGVRLPTFDKASAPKKMYDALCGFRRSVLEMANVQPENRSLIEEVNGGKPLKLEGMSCKDVRSLFNGVVAAKRNANRRQSAHADRLPADQQHGGKKKIVTLADLNQFYAEHYGTAAPAKQ